MHELRGRAIAVAKLLVRLRQRRALSEDAHVLADAARAPRNSRVLAIQTVQVTSDAKARPIITAFTMRSALRNMPQGESPAAAPRWPWTTPPALGAGVALSRPVAEFGAAVCGGACVAGEAAGAGALSP